SETYFAPDRSKARLTSRRAGCLGKTTLSKSFSIPVRTRSRSSASARSQPLLGTPVGENPLPHSHSNTAWLNSFILSELSGDVNLPCLASQSAKAAGVETPISGVAITHGKLGRSSMG